jgi:preprotein translocase subunit SecY
MLVLRYFAGFMVWATIAVVNAGLVGCTLYAYNTAGMLTQAGQWGAAISAQLPPLADPTGARMARWPGEKVFKFGMVGGAALFTSTAVLNTVPTVHAKGCAVLSTACNGAWQQQSANFATSGLYRLYTDYSRCCFYHAGMTRENWSYVAYALTAMAVLVFLLTMVMLSRVKVAIACIKVCGLCCASTRILQTHIPWCSPLIKLPLCCLRLSPSV